MTRICSDLHEHPIKCCLEPGGGTSSTGVAHSQQRSFVSVYPFVSKTVEVYSSWRGCTLLFGLYSINLSLFNTGIFCFLRMCKNALSIFYTIQASPWLRGNKMLSLSSLLFTCNELRQLLTGLFRFAGGVVCLARYYLLCKSAKSPWLPVSEGNKFSLNNRSWPQCQSSIWHLGGCLISLGWWYFTNSQINLVL